MSESDSDVNYESADDDTTENDISEKENVSERTELSVHPPISKQDELDSLSVSQSKAVTLPKSEHNKSNSSPDADSTGLIEVSKVNSKDSVKEISAEADSTGEIEVNKVESKDSVKEKSAKTKPETQRVPLRLEKKMQQKNQLSKESSQEQCSTTEKECSNDESNNGNVDNNKSSSWGFSSWGTSFLSTAASSVSTFSSQVSQGIGTVFETVESTLGAPSPEELASIVKEKKVERNDSSIEESQKENEEAGIGLISDVSAWTKVLESTGSKVIMGGLDTLELIGKKTMDILTEGDPGLRSKRSLFSDGVNLSQILREAKEKADKETEGGGAQNVDVVHYSQVFDDQQGLVHLEALEMLSKQTQAKYQRLLLRHSKKEEVKKRVEEIRSICENIPCLDDPSECEEFEDFESVFKKHVLELELPLNVDNIVKTQRKLIDTLSKFENENKEPYIEPDEISGSSISSLAEFTARCIETFHKVAELILVHNNLGSLTEKAATNLTGLTTVMCVEINNISNRYHKCLDSCAEHFPDYTNSQGLNITAMVTNLYVEASNSNKYIQDAFQMLIPVLQVCLLENIDD